MINANGYIKLVDLGFAKKIHLRTYTLCGTPEYLSPEQITLRGHGRGVDWWASGVFLYELLVGFTPFCFENKDLNPTIIYQNILNPKYEIEYPSRLSSEVVHLVSSLLRSKPMERVGCLSGGPADIRKHVFFQKDDFDWGKLLRLELPPPYVPKIKSETDVSNFDRIESKVDFFAGEPYDFSDARQWDVDFLRGSAGQNGRDVWECGVKSNDDVIRTRPPAPTAPWRGRPTPRRRHSAGRHPKNRTARCWRRPRRRRCSASWTRSDIGAP